MDTEGPVSVLDSGRRTRDAIVADSITRRRSPNRPKLRPALSEMDVVYRIPQPYRTSFSAKHSVERIPGVDRSRSLSPTTSLRSVQSNKSERTGRGRLGRAKSPKRVTYDTRVTVRHSDTENNMFAELQRGSGFESSPNKTSASLSSSIHSTHSKDSGLDYSTQLHDLSDQISQMAWSTKHKEEVNSGGMSGGSSRHGILKDSQNSREHLVLATKPALPHSVQPNNTRIPPLTKGDKENTPNGSPPLRSLSGDHGHLPKSQTAVISRDYEHAQSFKYQSVPEQYNAEIKNLLDSGIEDKSPSKENGGGLLPQQRSSSVSAVSKVSSANTSSQLTPAKRSVSTSISNFFRRISPRLGRKRSKDRNTSSKTSSSQSLPATSTSTSHTEPDSPSTPQGSEASSSHFSRNKMRHSFLKLIGKESKSKSATASSSTTVPSTNDHVESSELNNVAGEEESPPRAMPDSANRVLKSLEKNNFGKKDVYHEFKEKQSPHSTSAADANLEERYRAIKAQYKDRPPAYQYEDDVLKFFERPGTAAEHSHAGANIDDMSDSNVMELSADGNLESTTSGKAAEPPSSLNVIPSRTIRLLQASTVSTISGDESIGECSLDCNLTASEPSLLSGNSQSVGSNLSKKVLINQSLISSTDSQLPPDQVTPTSVAGETRYVRRTKDALVLGQELLDSVIRQAGKENASPLSPLSPSGDPYHKPSYLKLSCAVSGYGKYSRYSSYKNIPTRSPFSSSSSLRSDLSSPDATMPSIRSPDGELGMRSPGSCSSPVSGATVMAHALANRQACLIASSFNGHAAQTLYPTGDPIKDGEYFVSLMKFEEDRLSQQSKQAEAMMRSHVLPEEVNGRIRAAIGKSNLLINQKFQQFRDLCSQHMHPEPEERVPLYEDLQGFWDMIKIQIDNVDDMFAEIELMKHNGWKEIPRQPSRRSSASSSPRSAGSLSQASTPSATPGHTPGSKRRGLMPNKDTPESSPERTQKARSAAKARDEARKKMLAEKRAAMKQQQQQQQEQTTPDIEIFVPEIGK